MEALRARFDSWAPLQSASHGHRNCSLSPSSKTSLEDLCIDTAVNDAHRIEVSYRRFEKMLARGKLGDARLFDALALDVPSRI
jgi:hypothetical protein